MTAPEPLHPNTLAAHLKRKGFKAAKLDALPGVINALPGFSISALPGWRQDARGALSLGTRYALPSEHHALLAEMIAALGPEFEVAEDLGARVVVRRSVTK